MAGEVLQARSFSDPTRNSRLRALTREPIRRVSEKIHTHAPSIQPNHLTLAGGLLQMAGTRIAENERGTTSPPRKKILFTAAGAKSIGYLCDGLDGGLAKFKVDRDSYYGGLLDYLVDRVEETDAALVRARNADTHLGKYAAYGVALTCAIPGIIRAHAEQQGKVVPEQGTNMLEWLGTRPGRVLLDLVATFGNNRTRVTADVIGTTANVYSAARRFSAQSKSTETRALVPKKRREARDRRTMLSLLAATNAGLVYRAIKKS